MAITVVVVEDEDNARLNILEHLNSLGYETLGFSTLAEARACLERGEGDIFIVDVQLPDGYGPDLLLESHRLPFRPPMIVITAYGDIEMAVEAMRNGASDFVTKPFQLSQLADSVKRASEVVYMRRELAHWRETQTRGVNFIIGKSPAMQRVILQARKAAQAQVSVLITGETGTGKDVLARFIHQNGPRASKPYIAINCAAIQPTMIESELFGHEAGAFTGAEKRKHGLIEVADGGVLFMDEISSMSLDMQAKLLRAIEEQAIRRVGGTTMIKVDVQIIAASNRNLQEMIRLQQFRQDLYYRLKVVDLHLPPLRERKEDIPELVGYFIRHHNAKLGMNVQDVTPSAMEALIRYDWPGNIRELNHAIERAMLFCNGHVIDLGDLPADVIQP
ncbi:MAG: sigma-54-dependent transcriptional regulator [Thermanaerothrix sp.]|jgi:DNA-binding NtrC family response regulator|uniref:Sigma-54 dependent transcriptional regulator n=2 Tax=Thermanaerothrix TaxID=1077886 RepID=A0ABU3NL75_9CHLR|nr:sigma-54 dependent transcriptional regulator [Thermanaerothrix sp. 4228-RoL]MDT8897115.1 sigma-54 dependent transcriptional regulator [Thermanaerothrix sp. 4228-RoL]